MFCTSSKIFVSLYAYNHHHHYRTRCCSLPHRESTRSSSSHHSFSAAFPQHRRSKNFRFRRVVMAAGAVKEVLPPILDSTSNPPPIFDGATRLYVAYHCPYAQRTWMTRNYRKLQDEIQLVAIDLNNRPAWYKEKVYPGNKVPALEHNNEVRGESLDLIKYIDEHFDGPALLPNDPEKRQFAEELLSYTDTFNHVNYKAFTSNGDVTEEVGPTYDKIEDALSKFDDGPFFLGDFSLVDIAYAPFIERFQVFFPEIKKYDITKGRPKLSKWIEEMNKMDAYVQTKRNPEELITSMRKKFGMSHL